MEVRFRALRDSTLARNVSSGQSPAGEGQNFLEVVESVAGAEQTPGESLHAAYSNQGQAQRKSGRRETAAEEHAGDDSKDPAALSSHDASPSHNSAVSKDKPLGARIDLTV